MPGQGVKKVEFRKFRRSPPGQGVHVSAPALVLHREPTPHWAWAAGARRSRRGSRRGDMMMALQTRSSRRALYTPAGAVSNTCSLSSLLSKFSDMADWVFVGRGLHYW